MFKLTEEQKRIVDKVVEAMEIPWNYGPYSEDYDTEGLEEIYGELEIEGKDPVYEIECGATKAVLILDEVPAVLKVPFNGYEKQVIDYEDDWDGDYETEWVEYSEADPLSRTDEWNYCKTELEVYEIAEDEELSAFFPHTQYYTTISSHPIYLQEKAEVLTSYPDYYSKGDEASKSDEVRSVQSTVNTGSLSPYWILKAITYHGLELFMKLMNFLDKMNCMDDLHSGNVGFINGRPVLIDWIGWRE